MSLTMKYNVLQVVIEVTGHEVLFSQTEMTASVTENINGTSVIVDVNTTAELRGDHVTYSIVSVTPEGMLTITCRYMSI